MSATQHSQTKCAPLNRRILAMIYDSIILIALLMVAGLFYGKLIGIEYIELTSPHFVFYQLYLYACIVLFNGFFYLKGGQTLGMRAWRIQLLDQHHQVPSLGVVTHRLFWASLLLPLGGLGLWSLLFNPQKKCWYDRLSASYMIDLKE